MIAASYNNLGLVHFKSKNIIESLRSFETSLKIRGQLIIDFGFINEDILSSYNNIAGIYFQLNDYEKCLEYYNQYFEFKRKFPQLAENEATNEIAVTYNNLGLCMVKLHKFKEALENFEKFYQIKKEIYGEEHEETGAALINIASLNYKLNNFELALKIYSKVLLLYESKLSKEHAELIYLYKNIGHCLTSIGDFTQAEFAYKKGLDICQKNNGELNLFTSDLNISLGNLYENINQLPKTKIYLQKALDIRKKLISMSNYNNPNIKNSELEESIPIMENQKILNTDNNEAHNKMHYGFNKLDINDTKIIDKIDFNRSFILKNNEVIIKLEDRINAIK